MDKKTPHSTYIGIIAIGITFLGCEFALDYLMSKNGATLEAKVWLTLLIIGLYFVIANQLYNSKNN